MASRRLDAKIKQFMHDNPGVRYQKARDILSTGAGARIPAHHIARYLEEHPEATDAHARKVLRGRYVERVVVPRVESLQFTPTPEEAAKSYHLFALSIGVDDHGAVVKTPPLRTDPHTLIMGRAGTGKSTMVASFIEQFRAAGFSVWVNSLHDRVSVPESHDHVGLGTSDHAHVISGVLGELELRQAAAPDNGREWFIWRRELPPVVLIVDSTHFSRHFMDWEAVKRVMNVGKEFRIHVVVAGSPKNDIPSDVIGLADNKILMGGFLPDNNWARGSAEVMMRSVPSMHYVRGFVIPSSMTPMEMYASNAAVHRKLRNMEAQFASRMGSETDYHMCIPESGSTVENIRYPEDGHVLVRTASAEDDTCTAERTARYLAESYPSDDVLLIAGGTKLRRGGAVSVGVSADFIERTVAEREELLYSAGGFSSYTEMRDALNEPLFPLMIVVVSDSGMDAFTQKQVYRALLTGYPRGIRVVYVCSQPDPESFTAREILGSDNMFRTVIRA